MLYICSIPIKLKSDSLCSVLLKCTATSHVFLFVDIANLWLRKRTYIYSYQKTAEIVITRLTVLMRCKMLYYYCTFVYQPSNSLAAWTSILYPAPVTQPQVLITTPPIRAKNQIILSTKQDK